VFTAGDLTRTVNCGFIGAERNISHEDSVHELRAIRKPIASL
jgi:hypothetical protein